MNGSELNYLLSKQTTKCLYNFLYILSTVKHIHLNYSVLPLADKNWPVDHSFCQVQSWTGHTKLTGTQNGLTQTRLGMGVFSQGRTESTLGRRRQGTQVQDIRAGHRSYERET